MFRRVLVLAVVVLLVGWLVPGAGARDEVEPNGTFPQANALGPGEPAQGNIESGTDVDVFVTGAEGGDLVFAYVVTEGATTSDDSILTLYGDAQTLIESDDNDGWQRSSVVAGAPVPTGQAGDVFFEIKENGQDATIMPYELFQVVVDPAEAVAETGSNATAATASPTGLLNTGALLDGTDVDYWKVFAPGGSRIVVIMDNDPDNDGNDTDTRIKIEDPSGTTLDTGTTKDTNGGFPEDENANAAGPVAGNLPNPPSGFYSIRVENGPNGTGTDSEYQFVVQVLPGLTVTTFDDVIDDTDGVLSLREAIIAANNNGIDDEIHLPAGIYELAIAGTGETAAATGDLDILSDGGSELTILGPGATIDANGIDRVFNVRSGATLNVKGLTITGGSTADNGGGIATVGTATVVNSVITANESGANGGGILNNGKLTIVDSVISHNTTTGQGGGLVTSFNSPETVTVTNSTITGNTANSGGGIFVDSTSGPVTLVDSVITGNTTHPSLGPDCLTETGLSITLEGANLIGDTTGCALVADPMGGVLAGGTGGFLGDIGIGTLSPLAPLDIVGADPTIRLTDTGTTDTWQIEAGNSLTFSNGGATPVTFESGAPSDAIRVASNGRVGIGTAMPTARLEVAAAAPRVKVTATSATTTGRFLFELNNNGAPRFKFVNSNSGDEWQFSQSNSGDFQMSLLGSGGSELVVNKDGSVQMGPGAASTFDLDTTGNLTIGGTLTQGSDAADKTDVTAIDPAAILDTLGGLEISEWSYASEPGVRHVGPTAQDFARAFGYGATNTGIAAVDADGIALAAIQALAAENAELREANADLEQRLDAMEEAITALSN